MRCVCHLHGIFSFRGTSCVKLRRGEQEEKQVREESQTHHIRSWEWGSLNFLPLQSEILQIKILLKLELKPMADCS